MKVKHSDSDHVAPIRWTWPDKLTSNKTIKIAAPSPFADQSLQSGLSDQIMDFVMMSKNMNYSEWQSFRIKCISIKEPKMLQTCTAKERKYELHFTDTALFALICGWRQSRDFIPRRSISSSSRFTWHWFQFFS